MLRFQGLGSWRSRRLDFIQRLFSRSEIPVARILGAAGRRRSLWSSDLYDLHAFASVLSDYRVEVAGGAERNKKKVKRRWF